MSQRLRDTKRRRDDDESPTTAAHRRDGRGDVLSLSRGVRRHPLQRVSVRRRRGATDTDVPTPARARWIAARPIGRRGRDGVQKLDPYLRDDTGVIGSRETDRLPHFHHRWQKRERIRTIEGRAKRRPDGRRIDDNSNSFSKDREREYDKRHTKTTTRFFLFVASPLQTSILLQ